MRPPAKLHAGFVWFLTLTSLTSSAAVADELKGLRWVGPEAFVYAESTRPEIFLDHAQSDRLGQLLKAVPSYQTALAKPEVLAARGVAAIVAAGLGTTWEKGLRDLTGGGIVLAIEGTKGPERAFLVVTPKDLILLEKTHARLLDFVRNDAKSKKNPDPVTEAEHHGIKTYSLAPTEAHAIVSGVLIVANGPETLKTVIDRSFDPKSPTLADNPNFQARRKEADPEALAWAFARTDKLRAIDPKKFGGEKADAGTIFVFGPWLEAAQKGDWVAASLVWTQSRITAELVVSEPKAGYSAAMKRYLPGNGQGAPRISLPKNAIGGASLWRDFASIWEVRAEIFPPETVQGLAQLDTTAGTFFGGRDFATGVLGALGERWSLVVADQDFDKMNPAPDTKLPAFALVLELKPDDPEFATRLMAAFQSFLGLINLGSAQSKAPPLLIGSDTVDGLAIATSRYQSPYEPVKGEPVDPRFNFTPSAVQVNNYFVISSNLGLARDLARSLKEPAKPSTSTLVAEASGAAVAGLLERNRPYLVMQNMLSKGNAKTQAERETGLLLDLLRYAGRATVTADDRGGSAALKINLELDAKQVARLISEFSPQWTFLRSFPSRHAPGPLTSRLPKNPGIWLGWPTCTAEPDSRPRGRLCDAISVMDSQPALTGCSKANRKASTVCQPPSTTS